MKALDSEREREHRELPPVGYSYEDTPRNSEEEGRRPNIRKEIYDRSLYLYYIFFGIGVIFVIRILTLQYSTEGAQLRKESEDIGSFSIRESPAKRGDILSHDGRLLATTMPLYHLHVDFAADGLKDSIFKQDVDSLSISLASFFKDMPSNQWRDSLKAWHKNKLRYKRISPRRINYIELKEVSSFPIFRQGRNKGGLVLDTLQRRIFTHGSLARRTIGRSDEIAKFGLEGGFDSLLRGVNGVSAMQKISGDFWIPIKSDMNVEPIDGYNVVSTIDIEVQDVAEAALREQLVKHDAIWGTAILMEVSTGEIRAIANLAKSKSDSTYIEDFNYGVGMSMEPGSTFKLVTLMALLDDAKASINEMVNTESGVAIIGPGKTKVVDSHAGGFGVIPLKRVFEMSSNVGFAKEVVKYYGHNSARFTDYIYKLGIADKFGLQLPGEPQPLIRRPGDKLWNSSTLVMMSFGYALMLSPLNTLAIYNAIANDGRYVKPLFATEVRKGEQVIESYPTQVITERICSPSTLHFLKESLEGVVNDGTAAVLRNPNYKVAGKTGTAQVAKGKYGYNVNGGKYYLASIVGYFPADNPKYSCIVAIETFHPAGSSKTYYGGSLSGPVFRAIADKVFAQSAAWGSGITTSSSAAETRRDVSGAVASGISRREPYVKGGVDANIDKALRGLGVASAAAVSAGSKGAIVVIDSSFNVRGVDYVRGVVPELRGLALRDAVLILDRLSYRVKFRGSGAIVEQYPASGMMLQPGRTINLVLR